MAPEQNDNQIDKVLQALGQAAPPVGMKARIAERVQHQVSTAVAPSRTRNLIANCSPAAAWWRGALTGAAFASLAAGAVLSLEHRSHVNPVHTPTVAALASTPQSTSPARLSVGLATAHTPSAEPCAMPVQRRAVFETHPPLPAGPIHGLIAEDRNESAVPSHPAPAAPLTAEERELVRLARLGGPRELTSTSPDMLARLQEQQAADFDKFFTPPPPPSANNE